MTEEEPADEGDDDETMGHPMRVDGTSWAMNDDQDPSKFDV
jgi:hypothetical protein